VTFEDGESIAYDAALVATGAIARRPPIPGSELANVFTLRSLEDANAISRAADRAVKAVVVGASFIGMEAAASLRGRGLDVTVVAPDSPFEKTLGTEIGAMFRTLHEERGVQFELGARLARFDGDGTVREVILETGVRLPADLVLLGLGVRPATEFLCGIALYDDGGIPVDEHLRVVDGLWAAGDVASFPDARSGEQVRIEHWRTAEQLGRAAARGMLGAQTAFAAVPFFWTNQFGEGLQYVGHTTGWDEILFDGRVADRDFLACYVSNGRITAAAASKRDRDMAAIAELMRTDRMPSVDTVRVGGIDWLARLRETSGSAEPETRGACEANCPKEV
jgi:NADPH-dependent 2,4-dienoyl-CoA reductase/sulfur reductase-like enzyme